MTVGILPEVGHEALVDEMALMHGNQLVVHGSYLSKLQRNWRQANPGAKLVFSRVKAVGPDGQVLWHFSHESPKSE